MRSKGWAQVGAVVGIVLVVLLSSLASGHTTNATGSATSIGRHGVMGLPHADPFRYSVFPATSVGVDGVYVNSDVVLVSDVPGLPPGCAEPGCLIGGEDFLTGQILCDVEVLDDAHSPLNEGQVDGDGAGHTGGLVPDGTWDDGGIGGACHTTTYTHGDYNTAGCGTTTATQASSFAHGSDAVSGDDVVLVAGCDWKVSAAAASQPVTTCIIIRILDGDVPGAAECVTDHLICVLDPDDCFSFMTCGSGGSIDAYTYGPGGGHAGGFAFPSAALIAADGCSQSDAIATIFTVSSVDAGTGAVVPATSGWVAST